MADADYGDCGCLLLTGCFRWSPALYHLQGVVCGRSIHVLDENEIELDVPGESTEYLPCNPRVYVRTNDRLDVQVFRRRAGAPLWLRAVVYHVCVQEL